MPADITTRIGRTVDEIRGHAHTLAARRLVATMPTLDGEAVIDYRPGDWLRITLTTPAGGTLAYILPPDWTGP